MIRDVMQNAGLEIFAEIGLILFVLGFVFIVLGAAFMKRSRVDYMAHIPLNDHLPTAADIADTTDTADKEG